MGSWAKERMMKIVRRVIEERINNMRNNNNSNNKDSANDVVDVLLRDIGDTNSISNMLENICENIIEMMIPGEETLPTAMTMSVKFLSNYPVALSKLLVRFLTHNYINLCIIHPCIFCKEITNIPHSSLLNYVLLHVISRLML